MRQLIAGLFVFTFSAAACAGPFGLNFGSTAAQLSGLKLKQEKKYVYSTPSVPKPHPDFDDYRLIVTPKFGLCKYVGWISKIPTNSYGDGLREKYDRLYKALTEKYGEPQSFDYLKTGSIWNERRDFMMGLAKDDRTLVAYWSADKLSLPDNIGGISLRAYASNSSTGMISLTYSATNESECIDSIAAENNASL